MDNQYRHIVLQFDQAQQPKFEEKKGKGYVEFGKDNDYPKYLLSLYNESPKHGSIIKSKCNYIYGKGFENGGVANSNLETWNSVMKKCIKDDELYRGYFLQVIWNRVKQVQEVYHIEFAKVRVSKDLQMFYVKNDWTDYREKPRCYEAFNVNNPVGSQIFYYKEYNPTSEVYPLPSYFQALNMIECDIEVSRHLLGLAKQSFTGSTLIQLNNGDPINEEHRGEVERGLLKKFTGSDGKRVVIMFNKSKDNSAEIQPLSTSTLTKEDFTNVNNLIQSEIFSAHQIVSPVLFGISTAGALGQRNEIRDAYEIFNNTYIQERQKEIEDIFTKFRNLKGEVGEFKIVPVEPLKFEFTENIMVANLTQNEIRELMGREPLQSTDVTSDGSQAIAEPTSAPVQTPMQSNDAIRNLSGRQYQNVMRIVRQFGNGKLNKNQASLMLKNGFGFTDEDVNTFLGIDESPLTEFEMQKFSMTEEELMLKNFAEVGEDRSAFHFVDSKGVDSGFALELNQKEADVLTLITKDANITAEVVANTLNLDVPVVEDIIRGFVDREIIKITPSKINSNPKIEVLKPLSELGGKSKVTQLYIRYSYEWRTQDNGNPSRPFCEKMLQLSKTKMWSRADIEKISMRLGYSVFDRCGGWWTMPNGTRSEQCRHQWVSHLVTLK
jgi:hypothetical protein